MSALVEGGDGFTCCDKMKFFTVFVDSARLSLSVQLNVSKGRVRAVYLKHGHSLTMMSCPWPPCQQTGLAGSIRA